MLEDFRIDLAHDDPEFASAIPWPSDELRRVFGTYLREHQRILLPIVQSLLRYMGCTASLYDERMARCEALLRWNYYPPVPTGAEARLRSRFMAHEDIGLFTLLPCPSARGLQLLARDTGKWIRVAGLEPNDIVLNVGDTFQRISQDVLVSTTHRVSASREELAEPRISFPLGVYLADDDLIEPVDSPLIPETAARYAPIKAGDFRRQLLRKFRF